MIRDTLRLKAPGNWINDPNGFIYYGGKYHLFYQYFPYMPEWGTMHWGHAVSEDLVHWEHLGVALFPSKDYDRNGVFSGTALEKDGKLFLYYSAVKYLETDEEDIHRAKNEKFDTSQALVVSEDGYHFDNMKAKRKIIPVIRDEKIAHPVNTRDPKVWKYKNRYYMLLGSTLKNEQGRALFFASADGEKWEYVNQYQHKNFGIILECPDLFQIDGQYVFQGSPMKILEDGLEYAHNSICACVDFEEEKCELSLPEKYQFVDCGLDLYAPQTNLDKDGNRVMIGWMRMPESVPGDEERSTWNGMMCTPRVMEIQDGHIVYRMHPEIDRYMSKKVEKEQINWKKGFRLKTSLQEGEELNIGGYRIYIEENKVCADRSRVFGERNHYRNVLSTPQLKEKCELDIIADENLIEIFVNDGEYVLSNIVYGLEHKITGPVDQILEGREE